MNDEDDEGRTVVEDDDDDEEEDDELPGAIVGENAAKERAEAGSRRQQTAGSIRKCGEQGKRGGRRRAVSYAQVLQVNGGVPEAGCRVRATKSEEHLQV